MPAASRDVKHSWHRGDIRSASSIRAGYAGATWRAIRRQGGLELASSCAGHPAIHSGNRLVGRTNSTGALACAMVEFLALSF